MRITELLIAAGAALTMGVAGAKADLITWGGSFGDHYDASGGATKLDSTFWFELGTFGGFTPTAANVSDWAANWHVFDRAVNASSSPPPPASLVQWTADTGLGTSYLAAQVNITNTAGYGVSVHADDLASHVPNTDPNYINVDNSPSAGQPTYDFSNQAAYIWVFNDRRTGVGAQWGLYAGDYNGSPWAFPPLDEPGCLCMDLGAAFNLSDVNRSVVGTFAQSSPTTDFVLETVPEPGSAILIFATGMALLIKRKSWSRGR